MNRVLRGVVFDFDGVIVNSHDVHKRAWKKLLESVGITASEEDLQFILDGRTRDEILRHFLGVLDHDQLVEYGLRKEHYFREEAASVGLVRGLMSLLRELEEVQLALGIASSGSRSRIDFLLRKLELKKHFRVVVTGDEVQYGKPHPAVFLKAAQDLQLLPFELIAFEDALSGVKAASAAGMACIGIGTADRAPCLFDAGATHVVPDFRSLTYARIQKIFDQSSELRAVGFPR